MTEEKLDYYLSCIKSESVPAMGCTEPAAVALVAAYAVKTLGDIPDRLTLFLSQYIFKNGMTVGIPGTKLTGLNIAAAMGAVSMNPEKELLVLKDLSEEQKEMANNLVAEKRIHIKYEKEKNDEKIYLRAVAEKNKHTVTAIISGTHNHLTLLQKDDEILHDSVFLDRSYQKSQHELSMTLDEIWDFSKTVSLSSLEFLKETIKINHEIAQEGIAGKYGLEVGKNLMQTDMSGLISIDPGTYAVAMTSAAADARMAGCEKPVMSTAGSGNQGLTATLPVATIGWKMKKRKSEIYRALALSILITIYTKKQVGRLSVLCGCSIAAAIGSCAGIIFLLSGTKKQMEIGIQSMVADTSGVVCDGAKSGCALKIATAVSSAIRCAGMALNNSGASSSDGIVDVNAEKTLCNLGRLGNEGMRGSNEIILDMMCSKNRG